LFRSKTVLNFDSERAFGFFRQLSSSPRFGGTAEERKAAKMAAKWFAEMGYSPRIENFPLTTSTNGRVEFEVLSPYRKKYVAYPVSFTGGTPAKGVVADLSFAETGAPPFLRGLDGRIVMIYGALSRENYRLMTEQKVRGVLEIAPPGRPPSNTHTSREHRRKYGDLPTVRVSYMDALEMIRRGARRARLLLAQRDVKAVSQNVVAVLPGHVHPDEWILVGGHIDSQSPINPGACDNAAGASSVLEIAAQFAGTRPGRTLVFSLFGCEELGLIGSHAFTKRRLKDIGKFKAFVNLDLAGPAIGYNALSVTGSRELENYVKTLAVERGFVFNYWAGQYSSDNRPLNLKNVPSIAVARVGGMLDLGGHTHLDGPEYNDAGHIAMTGEFALEIVERLVNAVELPFEPGIPLKDMETFRANASKKVKKMLDVRA
jgi:aminopeptidase YwaD